MAAAFTYYKKCICSEGTSTTYAPGCPVHDPRMKAAFECSDCKRLESELAAVKGELAECKDFRKGTIHNAWLTAPREKLIEALQFQGATTKEYMEENAALRARCERLEGAYKVMIEASNYAIYRSEVNVATKLSDAIKTAKQALEVPREQGKVPKCDRRKNI